MHKFITFIISIILICILAGCQNKKASEIIPTDDVITIEDEIMNKTLMLKIDNKEVDVTWLENDSVNGLKQISKNGISIDLLMYGGNEQYGSLGKILPSKDVDQTSSPGDIMLYQSNKIVLFYGSNNWNYTKLGHINLSETELTNLLGAKNVTITLELK